MEGTHDEGTVYQESDGGREKAPGRRRWRSGTVARREVARLSKSYNMLLPRAPLARVVHDIDREMGNGTGHRWSKGALDALQSALESHLTQNFMRADIARKFAGRSTLRVKDIQHSVYVNELMPAQQP